MSGRYGDDRDNTPFTPPGEVERVEDYAPMTGKSVACTKCMLRADTMLFPFCQHKVCPVRTLLKG